MLVVIAIINALLSFCRGMVTAFRAGAGLASGGFNPPGLAPMSAQHYTPQLPFPMGTLPNPTPNGTLGGLRLTPEVCDQQNYVAPGWVSGRLVAVASTVLAESCDRRSGLAALCWQMQSQRPPDILMPVFAATCAG